MRVRNEAAAVAAHPLLGLVMGQPSAIAASEEAGQREVVASTVLPVKDREAWEILGKMGVVRGVAVSGDDLFVNATMPAGWTKRRTDHSLWSEVVDERGRVRASIFYKAAFYDRDAFMSALPRYRVDYKLDGHETVGVVAEDADGSILWEKPTANNREAREAAQVEAYAWLDAHRPKWRDVVASWED